jgi:hypothetical protein
MKTIYIDSEFKCHVTDNGTMTEIQTDFFDGKCKTFVEGYRFVPTGESWTRNDGTVFHGEMVCPWKPYSELDAAQREYERALILDMQNALNKLGVTLDE